MSTIGTIQKVKQLTPKAELQDSLITESGTTDTIGGNLAVTGTTSLDNGAILTTGSGGITGGSGSNFTADTLQTTDALFMANTGGGSVTCGVLIATNFNSSQNGGCTIQGVTGSSSAGAGKVGQYVTASLAAASAINLANATPTNVTSISLTAGDWDVWGIIDVVPAATTVINSIQAGISTSTGAFGAQDTSAVTPCGGLTSLTLPLASGLTPTVRVSLAATTTVYLVAADTITTSTATVYGSIFARRRR
jgi:hypothetical protein